MQVSRVYYPGLPSHPKHEVAKQQMKDYGGMVVFEMAGGIEASKRFVEVSERLKVPVLKSLESGFSLNLQTYMYGLFFKPIHQPW